MLSFLREQKCGEQGNLDTSKAEGNGAIIGTDAEATVGTEEQGYLTIETHSRNARKSTILFAVLFGIGMLCLWFMIKKSTPPTASATTTTEETQIEEALAQLTGVESEMFKRMDNMVKKFYEFSDVQQVQVNELAKNPFKLEIFLGNMKNNAGKDTNTEMIRQQQLRDQAENLELLSIMPAAKGYCCMIDDKILYEGDWIKGFKVIQINNNFVRLESESGRGDPKTNKEFGGIEIVLRLSE